MRFVTRLLTGGVALWGAKQLIARAHAPTSHADEVVYTSTVDGWRLALSRYRPRGEARAHPVVLVHGLASNRFTWDMRDDVSVARFLSEAGFDVFTVELRGRGLSDHVSVREGRPWGWNFDDYLEKDLPAVFDRVLAETGAPALHYVGHSMGGMLLYALMATGKDRVIKSGTTLGSALDHHGAHSDFRNLRHALPLLDVIPAMPFGTLSTLSAPLTGRRDTRLDLFNFWPSNTDPEIIRRVYAVAFHDVSGALLKQLASVFEPSGLRDTSGNRAYQHGLHRGTCPVQALAGDKDRQVAPEAVRRSLESCGSADKRYLEFGPATGCADHYGHCDLVLGKRAREETWPSILEWLDAHDQKTSASDDVEAEA